MNGSSCCSPSVGRMARTSRAVRSHRTVVSGRVIVVSRLVVVTRHASFVVGGRFRRVMVVMRSRLRRMVVVMMWCRPVKTSGVIAVGVMVSASSVRHIDRRMAAEEVVTVRIAVIDREAPCTIIPVDRTIEVRQCGVETVLVRSEHIAQVHVTTAPVRTTDVVAVVDTIEIVEVDFIHGIVLCAIQPQFIGHLVAEEQGFAASLVVCHCCGGDGYRHHHGQGHHLFHNGIFL